MPPKKPKLTPEEKKAAKIAKKAEKKRKTEERKKQQKRDYLQREITYSALTTKRHEKEWRQMLMKIALPRMRQELQFAWNNFERIVDCKDFTISLLMDELKDAEEQYMMNFRSHLENIDRLIEMFRDRLAEFKEDFLKTIHQMIDDGEQQTKYVSETSAMGDEYLKTMLYGLEQTFKEQERQLKVEYTSKIDDREMKYGEYIQRLKSYLENTHQKLWENTDRFLHDFFQRTKERRKAHDALKEQDDSVQQLIHRQLIRIINTQEQIKKLREKLGDAQRFSGMRISDLAIEKKFFTESFLTLKIRLEYDRKLDAEKMRLLAVESLKALNHLKGVRKRGEHILQLASICRKLETQKEKILPFTTDSDKPTQTESDKDLKIENLDERLHLFWQRVGQSNSLRFGINEEKIYLQLQNKMLKKDIHSYECLFCTKMHFEKVRHGAVPLTEGSELMRKYQKHMGDQGFLETYFAKLDRRS